MRFTKDDPVLNTIWEAPPRSPAPYPFICHFWQKRCPFYKPSIDKWCPYQKLSCFMHPLNHN